MLVTLLVGAATFVAGVFLSDKVKPLIVALWNKLPFNKPKAKKA